MFPRTFFVVTFYMFVLLTNGQENVCMKHNICGNQVRNNVSFTCERRYERATRCQIFTLSKAVTIMETERLQTVIEAGLQNINKAIEKLKCALKSSSHCGSNNQCRFTKQPDNCRKDPDINSNIGVKQVLVQTSTGKMCDEGFKFQCKGLVDGTSESWCLKHCSVGWKPCETYCNCTCQGERPQITTPSTENKTMIKCPSNEELSCRGKFLDSLKSWCNNYCTRNGKHCKNFCECHCKKRKISGFFRNDFMPTTASTSTSALETQLSKPTISVQDTSVAPSQPKFVKPVAKSCLVGFYFRCKSKNSVYSAEWCSTRCQTQSDACPSICSCRCVIWKGSGFLHLASNENRTIIKAPSSGQNIGSSKHFIISTTSTPSTVRSTTTQSPFYDMCDTNYTFECIGKQRGTRKEWCTRHCLRGKSFCNDLCICSCRLNNTPSSTTVSSTLPSNVHTTPVAQTVYTSHAPRRTPAIHMPSPAIRMPTPTSSGNTKVCRAKNLKCKWKGPNLGKTNFKMQKWCQDVCSISSNYCVDLRHICKCECSTFEIRRKICGASKRMGNQHGIADWCNRNCENGFCPRTHCLCKYIVV